MEQTPAKPKGYLNFSKIQVLIDIEFWLKFTQKKLDDWKLTCPEAAIQGTISMPMNNKVSSDLVIQGNFDEASHSKPSGGLLEFTIPGRFIHFNTIEEYQAFEFEKFKYF